MFKRYEGILDRSLYVALGVALLGVVFLPAGLILLGGVQGNIPGLLTAGVGAIGLITGMAGACILYIALRISRNLKDKEPFARCASMTTCCQRGEYPGAGQSSLSDAHSIGENP